MMLNSILPVAPFFIYTNIQEYQYVSAGKTSSFSFWAEDFFSFSIQLFQDLIIATDDIYRWNISKLQPIWLTALRLTNLPNEIWGSRRKETQSKSIGKYRRKFDW